MSHQSTPQSLQRSPHPLGRLILRATTAFLLLLGAAGCSNNVAPQACRDLVTAVGDKAVECGFDRAVNERVFEDNSTGSRGCDAVARIRDINGFYDGCIPFFEGLTCAQFDDSTLTLPDSCSMQLQVRRR